MEPCFDQALVNPFHSCLVFAGVADEDLNPIHVVYRCADLAGISF